MNKHTSPLLTFSEACNYLSIKQSRLRSAVLKREIPYIKIGRLIRFDLFDLAGWIESLKRPQRNVK